MKKKAKKYEAELTLREPGFVGNTLEFTARDAHCGITLDHPWAGDSESGFGQSLSHYFTPEEARKLGSLLVEWADSQEP